MSTPTLTAAPHESLAAVHRRVDLPHVSPAGDPAEQRPLTDDCPGLDGCPDEAVTLWSHLRTQAHQLADALRRRQQELDRREANLHVQAEQLEQETRSARLWWQGQLEELARREEELARREEERARREEELVHHEEELAQRDEELARRGEELARREDELPRREQELAQREEDFARREDELRRREAELDRREQEAEVEAERRTSNVQRPTANDATADVDGSTLDTDGWTLDVQEVPPANDANDNVAAADLESRREALLRAEALLAEELADVGRQRNELEAAVAAHRQQVQAADTAAEEQRRRGREDLEHRRQAIARETDRLEARRGELERLRDELRATQRETLEVRLAAEELWAQLSGAVPAASLTRAIGRIRQRLTDQYRLAATDVEDQKRELESLRGRLQQHHDRLAKRQQDLQQWFARRQAELHEQAERLALREEELSQERAAVEGLRRHWHDDRCRLHGELRELLAGAA